MASSEIKMIGINIDLFYFEKSKEEMLQDYCDRI